MARDIKNGVTKIHQKPYITKILERFEYNKYPCSTPADANTYQQLEKHVLDNKEIIKSDYPYHELIGSLLYLSITSRPDISNIVRFLSKFVTSYHELHVKFAKRVLQYLEGTIDNGLIYMRDKGENKLIAYSDASLACDYFNARSTTGILILMNGGPIFWKSVQQTHVSGSTLESEYSALSDCTNSIKYIQSIIREILGNEGEVILYNKDKNTINKNNDAVRVYCDNMAAVYVGNSKASTKKSRTVNIKFHNVKEAVAEKRIRLIYIPTSEQLADILTKNLNISLFKRNRDLIVKA